MIILESFLNNFKVSTILGAVGEVAKSDSSLQPNLESHVRLVQICETLCIIGNWDTLFMHSFTAMNYVFEKTYIGFGKTT